MVNSKCPKGYMLVTNPKTGKDECIKTSDFWKETEQKVGGRDKVIKMIYKAPVKGKTTLAKKGGSVKSKKKK